MSDREPSAFLTISCVCWSYIWFSLRGYGGYKAATPTSHPWYSISCSKFNVQLKSKREWPLGSTVAPGGNHEYTGFSPTIMLIVKEFQPEPAHSNSGRFVNRQGVRSLNTGRVSIWETMRKDSYQEIMDTHYEVLNCRCTNEKSTSYGACQIN